MSREGFITICYSVRIVSGFISFNYNVLYSNLWAYAIYQYIYQQKYRRCPLTGNRIPKVNVWKNSLVFFLSCCRCPYIFYLAKKHAWARLLYINGTRWAIFLFVRYIKHYICSTGIQDICQCNTIVLFSKKI